MSNDGVPIHEFHVVFVRRTPNVYAKSPCPGEKYDTSQRGVAPWNISWKLFANRHIRIAEYHSYTSSSPIEFQKSKKSINKYSIRSQNYSMALLIDSTVCNYNLQRSLSFVHISEYLYILHSVSRYICLSFVINVHSEQYK